jgi:gluconokinase
MFLHMSEQKPYLIPGLRSPSERVGNLVYFGRMLDKIRLSRKGLLPQDWERMRGISQPKSFDARCCRFLGVAYGELEKQVDAGLGDEVVLEWCFQVGCRPGDEAVEIWNAFMSKRGWRDEGTATLVQRLAERGLPPGTVETMFEFIDLDEGRLVL